jgi:hypothetical protein
MILAHIAFAACIAAIMIFWARTDDGRSAIYALLVLGAISTALVLEMEGGMLIWKALNRVLIEFCEVGGAAIVLVLVWATITTFIRERRRRGRFCRCRVCITEAITTEQTMSTIDKQRIAAAH